MTVSHHPGEALLLDYASGSLGEGWSLAVATHLALCPECRATVAEMEAIGGAALTSVPPEPVPASTFDAVMRRLAEDERTAPGAPPALDAPFPVLPQPLRRRLGGDVDTLRWRRLGLGARQMLVPVSDAATTVRLLCIPAGRSVPRHSHRGLELTLVLSGAFSDTTGRYGRGDLQEADEGLSHQPRATPEADCICLAVTDAPLRFSGLPARIVQPLLGI